MTRTGYNSTLNGSPKTVAASSNDTLCLRRFAAAFRGSDSNSMANPHYICEPKTGSRRDTAAFQPSRVLADHGITPTRRLVIADRRAPTCPLTRVAWKRPFHNLDTTWGSSELRVPNPSGFGSPATARGGPTRLRSAVPECISVRPAFARAGSPPTSERRSPDAA